MKIRQGNGNIGMSGASLVIGIPLDMRKHTGFKQGDEVMWRLNEKNRWELVRLVVRK